MIELDQILTGLVLRTAEGKVKWTRTVQDNRLATSVGAISVVIMQDSDPPIVRYTLDILDESGEIVESLTYQETTTEQDDELARLYVLARRSALNVDATLERLAKALDL